MVRPFFDQTEGYALSVLDALASGRRVHPLPHDKRLEPSEELVRMGCERLAIHLHRFLLRSGGHRERTVLRDGQRASGRLWDGPLNDAFRLRFTEASKVLWLSLAQVSLHPPRKDQIHDKLGRAVKVEGTECGDWLFYARVQQHVSRLGLEVHPDGLFLRRLRNGSPLVVLFALDPHLPQQGGRAATRNQLTRLLQRGTVRMVECLDDALLGLWIENLERAVERSPNLETFVSRQERIAEVLDAWLDALDEKQRLDLAAVVMRLMAAFGTQVLRSSLEEIRIEVVRRYAPRSVHERQAALAATARIAVTGVRLAELRDRFAALRYGDERWAEGQLYLAAFDDLLAPHLDRIRALERGLRGVIG